MKLIYKLAIAGVLLSASQLTLARSWTCEGEASIVGTGHTYSIPGFTQTGWALKDRQKKCMDALISKINSTTFLKKYGLSKAEEVAICKNGTVQLDLNYGINRRSKTWTKRITVRPACEKTCVIGGFK